MMKLVFLNELLLPVSIASFARSHRNNHGDIQGGQLILDMANQSVNVNQREETRGDRSLSDDSPLFLTSGIVGDLRRWAICAQRHPNFVETVRLFYQFPASPEGTNAFFVTCRDEVWAIGMNDGGRLGFGDKKRRYDLSKVKALSGKGIRSFARGEGHVLALTEKGEVYAWGNNKDFQVGRAEPEVIHTPTLAYSGEDPAVEIACGRARSVCRTKKGHVYCWGCNSLGELGIGDRTDRQTPQKVNGLIEFLKCTGIACSDYSTVAVFENGEVYAWGHNGDGILGIGTTEQHSIPVRVAFENVIVKKIACGFQHALALTEDGALYGWGSNLYAEAGTPSEPEPQLTPFCLAHGNIIEIAALERTSAAMTDKSEVLMWGKHDNSGGCWKRPTKVFCESMQDVFASLPRPETPVPLIPIPMSITRSTTDSVPQETHHLGGWGGKWVKTLHEHFDNPNSSDVKFLVGKQTIFAHKTVLAFQSQYFRTMFEAQSKKGRNDTIEVQNFSYPIYKAFLLYFYTGEVNLPQADISELLKVANFCSEDNLKMIFEDLVAECTDSNNSD